MNFFSLLGKASHGNARVKRQHFQNVVSDLGDVMKAVPDGIIVLDKGGIIHMFNPAAQKIFGYEDREVIGKNIRMLMPKPYYKGQDGYLPDYLHEGKEKIIGTNTEVVGMRKDGTAFAMEFGIGEMNTGSARMFVGTVRDISDQKKFEKHIQEEAARYVSVVNTMLDGLLTIDGRGVILSFNPAAVKIFGYDPGEVIGQNVKMLMPEPYHSEHDKYLSNYIETKQKKIIGMGREVSARRKDGRVFPIELGVGEVDTADGHMFVGTIRDITERKEAEGKIKKYIVALKTSNRELDDFAYIASHDLKEPIRGLSKNVQFLEEDYGNSLDDGAKKRMSRMHYLCERMERLVNDLLHFSRLGRQEMAIQETDLNSVVNDIRTLLEASLHEVQAEIRVPEPLPTIKCDFPRVTEMLRNLINNAIKYNKSDKKIIEIGSFEKDGGRVFYVKDNGIGIPEEFHQDIFRIFKRLNEEDDDVKGTGVGLTFVKKIVERHGGRIWLESKIGEGTTFYFTLNEMEK